MDINLQSILLLFSVKHSDMKMKANWAQTRKKFGAESTEIVVTKSNAIEAVGNVNISSASDTPKRSGIAWEID